VDKKTSAKKEKKPTMMELDARRETPLLSERKEENKPLVKGEPLVESKPLVHPVKVKKEEDLKSPIILIKEEEEEMVIDRMPEFVPNSPINDWKKEEPDLMIHDFDEPMWPESNHTIMITSDPSPAPSSPTDRPWTKKAVHVKEERRSNSKDTRTQSKSDQVPSRRRESIQSVLERISPELDMNLNIYDYRIPKRNRGSGE
jgi:hypothetical protein